MSYVETCKRFVKENGYITHKDILEITNTNCSYTVMQSLKKIFLFEEIQKKSSNGKPYILYLLRGKVA